MSKAVVSTLLHATELLVTLGAALAVSRMFDLGSDQTAVVIGITMNALTKFARASGAVSDYTR